MATPICTLHYSLAGCFVLICIINSARTRRLLHATIYAHQLIVKVQFTDDFNIRVQIE